MTVVTWDVGDLRLLRVPPMGHHAVPPATLDYRSATRITLGQKSRSQAMGNTVPASARPILERTLDIVRIRANSNGECFGGEVTGVRCGRLALPSKLTG